MGFGEHIEEYAKLMEEGGERVTRTNVHDLALGVADIAYAQGLIEEYEIDVAVEVIEQEARYLLSLGATS